jgi:hypothetical protein
MLTLVIIMGLLIVGGAATVAVTIFNRMGTRHAPITADIVLDQPAGTQIVGVASVRDQLAVALHGGGADRILLVDPATGRAAGRILLAR